ncbi:FIVAR domain-containing protein [Siminovitchia sp. FSL H7-0308]|uniref:FIVAR domain-containing protein n=1 Tax=Siminovitchia sp. FSL H7-0308 TaxID=2921432 RepID=UPI0030EF0197
MDKVKAEKRDTSAYTKASWKAFRDALRHAESILHDEQATQDDINKALQVLNSAREGLELLGEEKEELKPGKKDTTDAGESKLPNTATNIFNWFIVGLVLFLVGGLLIYRHRK